MNIQYEIQINIVDESFYLPKIIKLYIILLKLKKTGFLAKNGNLT